jgi:hypothetical protein
MKNLFPIVFISIFIIHSCADHSTKSKIVKSSVVDTVAILKNNTAEVDLCFNKYDTVYEKPIVMDWVNKDVGIIERIFNKLPEKCINLDSVQILIPNLLNKRGNGELEKYDLGNETEWYHYQMFGGYGEVDFEFITYQTKILRMNEYIENRSELFRPYFLPKIKVDVFCNGDQLEHIYLNQENISEYKLKYPHSLIDSLIIHPKNEEEEIFSFFTNYSRDRQLITYPKNVWDENLNVLYKKMAYLIDHQDYFTIENLVYSPLPEGRVFAAAALDYLTTNKLISIPIRPDVLTEMEKIKNSDRVIVTEQIDSEYYELTDHTPHDIFQEFSSGYLTNKN